MSDTKKSVFLFIPALLAYLGVLLESLIFEDTFRADMPTTGLIVAFGIIFFILFQNVHNRWLRRLQIVLEALIVTAILLLHPTWSVYPVLFFLVSAQASTMLDQRTAYILVFIFTVITAGIFLFYGGLHGLVTVLSYAAGYWFFAIFGWMRTRADIDRLRSDKLLIELQESHRQLKEYAARIEELAAVKERNRIAREVHDSLGHRLTVAAVQLEGAQRLVKKDPGRAETIIATVREQVREGLTDLRQTVAMLRSPVEEDMPLSTAITSLARQFEAATSLRINLNLEECPDSLPSAHRHAFYRAAQEGLTNIQRHANADEIWIQLLRRDQILTLLIGDNGKGLDPVADLNEQHFGLRGLKEQAAALGGDFLIDPRPGGGTQLTFRLPDRKEPSHD